MLWILWSRQFKVLYIETWTHSVKRARQMPSTWVQIDLHLVQICWYFVPVLFGIKAESCFTVFSFRFIFCQYTIKVLWTLTTLCCFGPGGERLFSHLFCIWQGPIYGAEEYVQIFLSWSEPEPPCSEWATAVWCSFYWVWRALQQSGGNDSVDQVFLIILGHKLPLSLVFKDNDLIFTDFCHGGFCLLTF